MKLAQILCPGALLLLLAVNIEAQPASHAKEKSEMYLTSADIILYNANVVTQDEQNPVARAIAITGNRISAVGSDADVLAIQNENTQVIDLEGKTVVPGLIEGHDHMLQQGFFESGAEGLARATKRMAADGYTTVHQLSSSEGLINTARELAQRGELAVRMNFYLPHNTNCNEDVVPWDIFPYTNEKDTTVRVVGVKIFADGGTCGFDPAITTPHQNGSGSYGHLFRTQEEMNGIVATVLDAGYPIAMHAIGDSAIGVGLNAFENAFDGQGNQMRCRMEHLRVMREDLANQMAALGIVASIQYTWARARLAPAFEGLYLPSVWDWLYPWRRMADRGIPIVGGNDFPYALRIQSMQTLSYLEARRTERSDTLSAWLDGDQLTIAEGLYAITVTNAWVAFEEEIKGTITPGKLADLTILSDDPLSTDPFDVRFIDVEMTIMDGVIRYDQLNQLRNVVHDAGTFSIGIDDRGLWGNERSPVGLQVAGIEQMFQGSVLMSYDSNTVATATFRQQDYGTSTDGEMLFMEPGKVATEEAVVVYEDVGTNHPNRLRVMQETLMWEDDPLLLVRYSFENIHDYPVSDLYIGQFMVFNVTGSNNDWFSYENDLGAWDENDGLGFAYMYANEPTAPYIGLAMFDPNGQNVNNALTFYAGHRLDWGGDEMRFGRTMRNGIIETETSGPGSYSVLSSAGPFSVEAGESISPFIVAFVVGENLEDLRNAVALAHQRSDLITSVAESPGWNSGEFRFSQNYPNPFNATTKITYNIPTSGKVILKIYNTMGQEIVTLVDELQSAGNNSVLWNGRDNRGQTVSSGVYIYVVHVRNQIQSKKMVYLK